MFSGGTATIGGQLQKELVEQYKYIQLTTDTTNFPSYVGMPLFSTVTVYNYGTVIGSLTTTKVLISSFGVSDLSMLRFYVDTTYGAGFIVRLSKS